MGEIVELHPRDPRAPQGSEGKELVSSARSIEHATQRLSETVTELVRTLEASHRRIKAFIDTIPDAEVAARLARDHALLSAALRDAKAKAASVGLMKSGV